MGDQPSEAGNRLSLARTSGLRRAHRPRFRPVEPIPAGTLVAGKYRIVSLLGEGGMGAVYRAEHVIMKRPVALKVMRPEMATDPAMTVRFTREAQAASRIVSRHVVTIHDFGQADDGTLYLVMELLSGEPLAARLESRLFLPWQEAVGIAIQMCEALQVAHAADVVHRDLKPDNVFLCADGTVKVLDFGIARILPRDESGADARHITHAGSIVGTPIYMSPEAAAHRPVGPHADLYALGAILFEMLTGRLVFEDEHLVLLLSAHMTRHPDRLRAVRPELDLPLALDALVDRLLAKDPAARHPDAATVAAELTAILEAEGFSLPAARTRASQPGLSAPASRRTSPSIAITMPAGAPTIVTPSPTTASGEISGEREAVSREAVSRGTRTPTSGPVSVDAGTKSDPGLRAAKVATPVEGTSSQATSSPGAAETTGSMPALPVASPSSRWWVIPALAAVAVVGVAAYLLGSTSSPAEDAAPIAPVAQPPVEPPPPERPPEPPPVAAPATVELQMVTTPPEATITLDGAPMAQGHAVLPRDSADHVVVVAAEGYVERSLTISADRDREIVLALERAPVERRGGGRPPARGGRGSARSGQESSGGQAGTPPPGGDTQRTTGRGHIVGDF